jgi:hypothetical protein
MNDRTVHASYLNEEEIVRYNRAGKWYIELPLLRMRRHVKIAEAVQRAVELSEMSGVIYFRRPGGSDFDRLVRAVREAPGD